MDNPEDVARAVAEQRAKDQEATSRIREDVLMFASKLGSDVRVKWALHFMNTYVAFLDSYEKLYGESWFVKHSEGFTV